MSIRGGIAPIASASDGGTGTNALPGSPWTEWGWATKSGSTRAASCYREGMATNSGREMARFLRSLGATFIDKPVSGPDWPSGKRC